MTVQVDEDTKRIQELLSKGEYQAIFDQYAPVLQDMLFVQSLEEWLDFIRQEGALEEEPLKLCELRTPPGAGSPSPSSWPSPRPSTSSPSLSSGQHPTRWPSSPNTLM